jgi:hypothetical protein
MVISESDSSRSPVFAPRFFHATPQAARSASDQENQIARFLLGLETSLANCGRIHRLPAGSSITFVAVGCFTHGSKRAGLDLAHFAPSVARGTLDELLGHAVGVRIARLADIVEVSRMKKAVLPLFSHWGD